MGMIRQQPVTTGHTHTHTYTHTNSSENTGRKKQATPDKHKDIQ